MTRGSLIGLAAGGAAATLVVIVAVLSLFRSSGENVPRVTPSEAAVPSPDESSNHVIQTSKGSQALRAQGCSAAIVADLLRLLGEGGAIHDDEPRYIISCDVMSSGAPPACDKLATAYFAAIGGATDGRVVIRVSTTGSRTLACSRMYAPNGADMGPYPRTP
jgi:hypothetical protein